MFSVSVNAIHEITCLINTSLLVCFIFTAAMSCCSLLIDHTKSLRVALLIGSDFMVLGLTTNVPLVVDYLQFFMQLYVLEAPIVNVVLGQPFLHCATAAFTYNPNGGVDFVISEPGNPHHYLVLTQPLPMGWELPNAAALQPSLSGILCLGLPEDVELTHANCTLLERLCPCSTCPRHSLAN